MVKMEEDDTTVDRESKQEDKNEDKDQSTIAEAQETNDSKQKMPQTTYVRLRGLPYSAKESDIRAFLDGIPVTTITMSSSHNGRPSGECYCELPSKQDTLKALEFHRKEMEGRYIEIFTVSIDELTNLKRVGLVTDDGKVIRLRGLPFSATIQDVKDFFKGLNCEEVVFGRTGGRPSGEAFVRLATREEAAKALDFNKQHMGSRYVEVFRTTVDDMERNRPRSYDSGYIRPLFDSKGYDFLPRASSRSIRGPIRAAPYDLPPRLSGYGRYDDYDDFIPPTKVFMRGLPFDADAYMIEQFFAPLRCIEISLGFNDERRPSGDAVVEFASTAEAHEAFSRNKAMMGKRYVELFGSNDMPNTMRRLTWRVVGGQPAPRPLALVAPRVGYGSLYGSMHGGYGRAYDPIGPGPFRSYSSGGGGRSRRRSQWKK
ncbi:hypothetical protein DICVIV_05480 [Dictyocaulus viviparus]|uniref:RRM domain-containing protein n=1 Tax=Dictyocaulus viviparus TaxID=29172 RepID=A0A0D8XV96_DICVI|nr:hypothetical protein DICVIV_05480 [Dictyocaulus viviparus]